jgi:competence protein ComEA
MDTIKNLLFISLLSIGITCFAVETIDINSADKETLMTVKGVGETRAEAIINYREKFGPFISVDQLMEVEGIGEATLDANRDILIVNRRK